MVEFNPDVQPVQNPESIGATRPIDRPIANEGLGKLFAGIGGALKDAGEIFKDTVKVADYSNKKDIENKGHIGADAQTAERTTLMEGLAQGVGVDVPGMRQGLLGDERAQADDPNSPLGTLPKTAGTLKAARADLSQIDLYYKARALALSKSLRQEYPGYRDYIDKTMEQEFSGHTPANDYVRALNDAFLKNQALLNDENKRDIAMSEEGVKKGWVTPDLHAKVVNGEAGAIPEMRNMYYSWSHHNAQNELFRSDISTKEAGQKANDYESSHTFSTYTAGATAIALKDKDLQDFIRRGQENPDSITEGQTDLMLQKLSNQRDQLKIQFQQEALREQPYEDGSGKTWSHLKIQGQAGVNKSIEDGIKPIEDQIESLGGKKNYDWSSVSSKLATARSNDFKGMLMRDKEWGPILSAADSLKNLPETMRELTKQMVGPDKLKGLNTNLQNTLTEFAVRMTGSINPPPAIAAIKAGDPHGGGPQYNRSVLDIASSLANSKLGDDQKRNIAKAFFSDRNRTAEGGSIFGEMYPADRAKYYEQWTHPEFVSSIKALGAETFKNYQKYMSDAFGESVFKGDLDDLGDINLNFIPNMKITFNPDPKSSGQHFGLQIGEDTDIQLRYDYQLPRGPGEYRGSSYAAQYINAKIIPTLNKINTGIGGFKNVMDTTPEQTNAAIVNALRGSGHDYTAQGTIGEKLWSALHLAVRKAAESGFGVGEEGVATPPKKKAKRNVVQ